jgi:hypothetical protein
MNLWMKKSEKDILCKTATLQAEINYMNVKFMVNEGVISVITHFESLCF